MDSLLYSETFFLVSSFCLMFITLLFVVVLIYVINIMRVSYDVIRIIKRKAIALSRTLDDIEDNITESRLVGWLAFLLGAKTPSKKKVVKKAEK